MIQTLLTERHIMVKEPPMLKEAITRLIVQLQFPGFNTIIHLSIQGFHFTSPPFFSSIYYSVKFPPEEEWECYLSFCTSLVSIQHSVVWDLGAIAMLSPYLYGMSSRASQTLPPLEELSMGQKIVSSTCHPRCFYSFPFAMKASLSKHKEGAASFACCLSSIPKSILATNAGMALFKDISWKAFSSTLNTGPNSKDVKSSMCVGLLPNTCPALQRKFWNFSSSRPRTRKNLLTQKCLSRSDTIAVRALEDPGRKRARFIVLL